MKRINLCWGVVILFITISAYAQTRSLPTFEVDRPWPKVPAQWKLGDPSSIAIDAKDNVWVLHRSRTLKPEDAAKAAPPVIVFDTAGNYIKAWGGAGSGYEWPEREHGIHIDYKGNVWLGGNNCPTNGLPGLKPVKRETGSPGSPAVLLWSRVSQFLAGRDLPGRRSSARSHRDIAPVQRAIEGSPS